MRHGTSMDESYGTQMNAPEIQTYLQIVFAFATHWDTLGHTATRCNAVQHIMTYLRMVSETYYNTLQHVPIHCNTLQHTATYCNILQHTATHCNTLQHTATHCNMLQYTATHCNILQRTATHCNTLQHSASYHDVLANGL